MLTPSDFDEVLPKCYLCIFLKFASTTLNICKELLLIFTQLIMKRAVDDLKNKAKTLSYVCASRDS